MIEPAPRMFLVARPELNVVIIATISAAQLKKLLAERLEQADIILCVEEDVPGSY